MIDSEPSRHHGPVLERVALISDVHGSAPFAVQFVRVPYDVASEIAVAMELGMPQLEPYAAELRTASYQR